MAKVSKPVRELAKEDDFIAEAKEYIFAKKQIEYFEKKTKELRDKILEQVSLDGEEDTEGHITLDLPTDIDGIVSIKKERRVSRKIDESKAEEIIQEKGLEDSLYKVVRVIDEDALMSALYEDVLTEAEIDQMYPQTITWALKLNKK